MWKILREWLFSWIALRAYIQLLAGLGCLALYAHLCRNRSPEWVWLEVVSALAGAGLVVAPVWYFAFPPLFFGIMVLMIRLRGLSADYPCPVCGYDIRETPHRCPECGTELRWGQLIKPKK